MGAKPGGPPGSVACPRGPLPSLAAVNPSTALARVVVDELVRSGVTEVVLAPGSRSAPLAFALHAEDAASRLRLHVRVDERTAGFLALGLARSRGVAAVVTTSGTAVANLHPAVLEAHHAGVPLVVLSADRPAELRGVGANQTVDQPGLFGSAVRYSHDMAADERPGQVAYWRATVSRAVLSAVGAVTGDPGPVHLNVAFREPLVPAADGDWVEPLDGRGGGRPWTERPAAEARDGAVGGPVRTLVVVGDASVAAQRAAMALARRRRWPVVAEPSARAGSEAVDCAPLVVAVDEWVAEHRPERVLVVGRPTLSRSVGRLLRGGAAPVEVVATAPRWADAGHAASRVHHPDVLWDQRSDEGDPAFLAAWEAAGGRARAAVDGVLAEVDRPTSLEAARAVTRALPPESLLFLGSSSVVRDVDLVGGRRLPEHVLANRGVGGIDGSVSTAIGAALGRPEVPSYALLGDLTFLHDMTGLLIGPDEPRPNLTIVVVNDDGGGIFGLLEQGAPEHAAAFERVFGTPQGVDLGWLCAAGGAEYVRSSVDDLPAVLAPQHGIRVVEVPVDRTIHRELHARLRAAVATALLGDQ